MWTTNRLQYPNCINVLHGLHHSCTKTKVRVSVRVSVTIRIRVNVKIRIRIKTRGCERKSKI